MEAENKENPRSLLNLPPALLVLVAVLLWSTGGLFFKWTTVTGYEANLGRCFFAAITIAILTYKKGLGLNGFTLIASLFYVGALSFFALANKMTTAANAIFLQYTAPVYILFVAPFLLKEKFKWTDLITVAICILGMILFFVDDKPVSGLSSESQFIGNILGLLSGVSLGGYILLLRHPKALQQNPAVSVFWGNLLAILFMLPFVISNPSPWMPMDFVAVFFLGVFQIGIAYFLFTKGVVAGVRSLDASLIGLAEPLLNPVWVFLFVGERPSNWALLGGGIIIASVAFHTLKQNLSKTKAETPAL